MPTLRKEHRPVPGAGLGLALLVACQGGSAATHASSIDAARAWTHLEKLVELGPRPSGSKAIEEARALIERELRSAGLDPVREPFRARTPIGEIEFANVYADLPAAGGDPSSPMIILGTHFDTKRLPFRFVGANDGGAGTAVLLELARVKAGAGGPVAYRFLFLDGEEATRPSWTGRDNRYGSRHHAAALQASGASSRVQAFVLLDLVGDKDLKLTSDSNSSPWLLALFFDAAREIGLGRHVGAPRQGMLDDHLSFLEIGVESVDLIDFEFGPDNEWWHSEEDTLENCSRESLDAIGRIVLAGLAELERRIEEGSG